MRLINGTLHLRKPSGIEEIGKENRCREEVLPGFVASRQANGLNFSSSESAQGGTIGLPAASARFFAAVHNSVAPTCKEKDEAIPFTTALRNQRQTVKVDFEQERFAKPPMCEPAAREPHGAKG